MKEPTLIKTFERQLQGLDDLDTEEEETRNSRIHAGPEYGLDFVLEYNLAQDNKVSYRAGRQTVFCVEFLDDGLL